MQTKRNSRNEGGAHARSRRTVLATTILLVIGAVAAMPSASADHPVDAECAITPGGWSSEPRGNNPGALLEDHFDEVFGDSFTVDGHTFEDAEDVREGLDAHTGDPLYRHAVALKINIEFGNAGLFPEGTVYDVEVDEPGNDYDGETAQDVLAAAETALEDPDRSTSKYSDLIDAMTGLNEEAYGCKPVPPANLVCVARADRTVHLDWDAVEDADLYKIYRSTDGENFTFLNSTTETEYTDASVIPEETYSYFVTSVDAETGKESGPSNVCEVTAIPFFPGFVAAVAAFGAVGAVLIFRRKRG